jgi:hypothetical protein
MVLSKWVAMVALLGMRQPLAAANDGGRTTKLRHHHGA